MNGERRNGTKNEERGTQNVAELSIRQCCRAGSFCAGWRWRIGKTERYGGNAAGMSFVGGFSMTPTKRMSERTLEFSTAVITEFRRIRPVDEAESVVWTELLKTQKSLAANTAESTGAQSRRDFTQKFHIALKESREALQLLQLLHRICPQRQREVAALIRQCDEITAVLVASLKTAKRNQARDRLARNSRA